MQGFALLGGKALERRLEDVSAPAGVCDRCEQSAGHPNRQKRRSSQCSTTVEIEDASLTNFEYAKKLFAEAGYALPEIVFWNVASRNRQQPVTKNEQGVALVSGCTPRLFEMVASGTMNPYAFMLEVVESERYAKIVA